MYDELKQILVEDMQIDEKLIKPEAELSGDLNINSIELADLIMTCEEKFNIEVDEERISKFVTISDIVEYLTEMAKEA